MTEYEFTLKFDLPSHKDSADNYINALYEAGCDDALVGVGSMGRIALNFVREAGTARKAIYSAIDSVLHAIPGASLTEASPDLVTLTDLADLLDCSRQNLRKYYIGDISRDEPFPAPAFAGKTALWHLAKVGKWINKHSDLKIPEHQIEAAQVTFAINVERDQNDVRQMA